jgi:hypothetical protein
LGRWNLAQHKCTIRGEKFNFRLIDKSD